MSRLDILKASLEKKKNDFDAKLDNHFATVREANGQPLNDKRNGRATLNKWERQNDSLRNAKAEIEKTQAAIEREEDKIARVEYANDTMPAEILALVESGVLKQWRKHPTYFFVDGVDRARIVWIEKDRTVAHKYFSEVTDKDMRKKFVTVYNELFKLFNQKAN